MNSGEDPVFGRVSVNTQMVVLCKTSTFFSVVAQNSILGQDVCHSPRFGLLMEMHVLGATCMQKHAIGDSPNDELAAINVNSKTGWPN